MIKLSLTNEGILAYFRGKAGETLCQKFFDRFGEDTPVDFYTAVENLFTALFHGELTLEEMMEGYQDLHLVMDVSDEFVLADEDEVFLRSYAGGMVDFSNLVLDFAKPFLFSAAA